MVDLKVGGDLEVKFAQRALHRDGSLGYSQVCGGIFLDLWLADEDLDTRRDGYRCPS